MQVIPKSFILSLPPHSTALISPFFSLLPHNKKILKRSSCSDPWLENAGMDLVCQVLPIPWEHALAHVAPWCHHTMTEEWINKNVSSSLIYTIEFFLLIVMVTWQKLIWTPAWHMEPYYKKYNFVIICQFSVPHLSLLHILHILSKCYQSAFITQLEVSELFRSLEDEVSGYEGFCTLTGTCMNDKRLSALWNCCHTNF